MRITITPVNIALSATTNKIVIYTSGCIVGSSGGGTWGSITGTLSAQTDLQNALNAKVDKVTGKQLSTEDYTTIEKQKLAGIEAGAEVNVNADWNATSGDAKILNKPTLATVATSGSYNDLSDKPTIPTKLTATITISVADWSGGTTCTKLVAGLLVTDFVTPVMDRTNLDLYVAADITGELQAGQIVFTCATTPTSEIVVPINIIR